MVVQCYHGHNSDHKEKHMNIENEQKTLMFKEAQETHSRVALQLQSNRRKIEKLGDFLRDNPPAMVMTCGRGSSDHAATYAKYLIETHLAIPTLSVAPSITSVFSVRQDLKNVIFLVISQSGQSPDILSAAITAKESGAFLISMVNDENSPLALVSNLVLPLHAGPEKSVAATKSYICSLTAIAQLVAVWAQNKKLINALATLPAALEKAFDQDWSGGMEMLKKEDNLFVVSRGLGLGIAQEAALKFKETCGLHAEAFSAAEVKHGPMAIVKKGFPVLVFSLTDQSQDSIDEAIHAFLDRSAQVLSVGNVYEGALNLNSDNSVAAELRPIIFIQSFYKFVNALSVARGYNPDCPPYLNKVTETL